MLVMVMCLTTLVGFDAAANLAEEEGSLLQRRARDRGIGPSRLAAGSGLYSLIRDNRSGLTAGSFW
jgi:hypothetical protein